MTGPLLAFAVVFSGLLGLVIGSFLNVVAYRVPAGIPLTRESRCPRCDAPVRWWQNVPVVSWLALRGRCAHCRAPIAARYPLVEAATGVVFAGVTWWWAVAASPLAGLSGPAWLALAAFLYLAAISIVLAAIDLDTHRLPDVIVLPSYVVAAVLLSAASILAGDLFALVRAAIGMVALYVFFLVIRLIRPGGMGGGDVKLAGLIGMYLGWIGWGALVVGAFAAFLLGGLFGIALIAAGRARRKTAIPFGPWMLLGAWVGVAAGETLGGWYAGLLQVGS